MTGEPPLLLLAEDDLLAREVLVAVLAALPARVDAVADGAAALAQARAQRYDLLVLDLAMPAMGGAELLAALRADRDAASQEVPALALSAEPGPLPPGFRARLVKPVPAVQLRRELGRLLGATSNDRVAEAAPVIAASTATPRWDDARALAALGGKPASVAAMRELLRGELPGQREALLGALDQGDRSQARALLHRMRAAAGFCGAAQLEAAVMDLEGALAGSGDREQARQALVAAMAGVLDTD